MFVCTISSLCQVTEEVIQDCITARHELEKACEPLKGKKPKRLEVLLAGSVMSSEPLKTSDENETVT